VVKLLWGRAIIAIPKTNAEMPNNAPIQRSRVVPGRVDSAAISATPRTTAEAPMA
jgi:hypothetical protein